MAVTLTAAALAAAIGAETATAERLLPVATALVERYAPDAPEALQNEAVVRCGGYLHEMPGASIRSEATGDIRTSYAANNMSPLRHSGAIALLSPWKARRGGAI